MAHVTIGLGITLMWICKKCGATFDVEGTEHDPRGTNAAVAHEKSCGSDARIGTPPPQITVRLEGPVTDLPEAG